MQTGEVPVMDIDFLERAFNEHYKALHRYAFTMLKENEAAKDAVQQVFANVWAKRATIDADGRIKSYLYRSVHNHCLNATLRIRAHEELPDESRLLAVADFSVEVKELQASIIASIERLPPQCKLVFLKNREEDKSYKQIASELNIAVKTVEAQISKALKLLRTDLAPYIDLLLFLCLINHYNQF